MPLKGFQSLCNKNEKVIVSKDKRNPQYHKGINTKGAYVTHYQIDGIVIKEGSRCDYLLINEDTRIVYLIELKGSDLVKAAKQLEETEKALEKVLSVYNYKFRYRIVANKCKTTEIRSSAYRKYQILWKSNLVQKTGSIVENI